MSLLLDWWAALNHGGLLIAPNKIQEFFQRDLEPLSNGKAERLRREVTRFDGTGEGLSPLLDFLLEDLCGLTAAEWQKAQHVDSKWSLNSFTKEQIKPRRIWIGPNGETLPVFVPQATSGKLLGNRLGVGKSRRMFSRVLEWLRRQQQPLALLTNGRQLRLVHAGQDYDAWCEWDIDLWFAEGAPSAQVFAWQQLLDRSVLVSSGKGASGTLLTAILDSRKGQAELSAILGERVRLAVEELVTASHATIENAREQGVVFDYRDLYMAGTRIIMRYIVTLFAEARGLLPVDNRIYQHAYSIDGLRQQLDRRASGRGGERLSQGRSAWPRVVALFNLVYHGSSHEALPVPQYSGNLFKPGNADGDDRLNRALALLEDPTNPISDKQVRQILRLLTRTKVQVRQGRRSTWVDGPVDFAALSTEYIGILYEGLLDFELKRAEDGDPIIFISVGRQPALPLSRLEGMDDRSIKQLFEELKKKDSGPGAEEEGGEEEEGVGEGDEPELETADDAGETGEEASAEEPPAGDTEEEIGLSATDLERAQAWLERAAEVAGLVRRPRGRGAVAVDAYEQARRTVAKQLCARLIAPGEFYLVRWGGTRKGAGTFYTRPQLAAPTVRRALLPLAFEPVRTETDPRTGLEEVVEWIPRKPEAILALKVCDPTMGSGSFPVSALRFLTDALVQSLYHYHRIDRSDTGAVARLADGHELTKDTEQPIPLPPDHEGFEDVLRVQLKRHVVERCIYGADIDPLAVELGRMALWIETMDRTLPFGFMDHKLKVGNTLLGTWFDTFREYPAMAWERDGGDSTHDRFVNHFHDVTVTRGKNSGKVERKGDVWSAAIKERKPEVQQQLINRLSGQRAFGEDKDDGNIHDELTHVFEELHAFPVHETEKRALFYQEKVLNNQHYHALKERMDLWCALWFWPGNEIDEAPTPDTFAMPSAEAMAIARRVAREQKFFHWELEFPDVFTPERKGFDGMLGNPPWEIQKPNSKEFFSNIDPLYRAYGKQEALAKQVEYFQQRPNDEKAWLRYCAVLKARSNWIKYSGHPFGDNVTIDKKGSRKHGFNLGGGFSESERLHERWRKQRARHVCYADFRHPFLHQGSADLNTYKMFLEQSHALLRDGGRLGMIVPSGIYTDKGTTALRELFLEQCDWQWLFGFENREKVFDIDSRFKFCPLVIQKSGVTTAIRATFMHRDVNDWDHAEHHVLAYPHERVEEFSPYSKAILEIRTDQDLQILQKIYANGILLGNRNDRGWEIKYATEFHMTSDSKLFPERPKWEAKGYIADEYGHWLEGPWQEYNGPLNILDRKQGLIISRDGSKAIDVDQIQDVAMPLLEGNIIEQFDVSSKGWVSGKGRTAIWREIPIESKVFEPQYLISVEDARSKVHKNRELAGLPKWTPREKVAFIDVTSATNARTARATCTPYFPCGNTAAILETSCDTYSLAVAMNTFIYDFVARARCGGLHLNWFVVEETVLPKQDICTYFSEIGRSLIGYPKIFSDSFKEIPRIKPAITLYERIRLRCISEALMANSFEFTKEEFEYILRECDFPRTNLTDDFTHKLNPKGFWRIDKTEDPELRLPVLSFVAFCDLQKKGLDIFLNQNDGEGWMLPKALRLADYGLGHDDRAQEYQPVASRLGPRFYDWQLCEDVSRSWKECEAHAALIRKIVPIAEPEKDDHVTPAKPASGQMTLF
ncbi:hypothetical protein KP003_02945 [Geomonas nitrogeniifigens]|uniref:Eco57I restriction-modification methylase domain-containing protein n=1 Tax=Geomonas diazotrophica TaxID=2843197 RepID=UPI001C2BD422|nr:hypothetical protein [Geomonas nitrogeniifigens]QXE87382.1 hypothetical protein KP003_02945 [Geomonas nitrogeniifigens]